LATGELRQVVEKFKEYKWLRGREMSDEEKGMMKTANNVNSFTQSG